MSFGGLFVIFRKVRYFSAKVPHGGKGLGVISRMSEGSFAKISLCTGAFAEIQPDSGSSVQIYYF